MPDTAIQVKANRFNPAGATEAEEVLRAMPVLDQVAYQTSECSLLSLHRVVTEAERQRSRHVALSLGSNCRLCDERAGGQDASFVR